jgi:hypothetical protein
MAGASASSQQEKLHFPCSPTCAQGLGCDYPRVITAMPLARTADKKYQFLGRKGFRFAESN